VSSKADDFDVRYRDAGETGHGRPGANGGYGGTVDYDLGYDGNGWDTNGFRSPAAGYPAADYVNSQPHATGAHATRTQEAGGVSTQEIRAPQWEPGAPGASGLGAPELPHGPAGPRGPRGLSGPGRRGRNRTGVKVKGSWWRHWTLRKAAGLLLSIIGGIVVLGAIAVVVVYEQTPVPTAQMAAVGYTQSVVYSKDGTLIGRFGTTNRQMLNYDQIPPTAINAVLAAEDRNFFNEGGISPTGTVRAAYEDVKGNDGSLQGGSTITQEFVRNFYSGIGTQQTLSRKIKEIFVALKVGKEKSKQWILTNYLNTIYLGDGAYGIGAAAQTYFGEPVSKLDVAQAAVLAAVIQQPSTYPLPQYRPELEARWHYVLNGMVQMGNLTQQQAATMKFPKMGDNVPQIFGKDVWDPYVLAMIKSELTQVYGFSQQQIDDGGYVIRTSIDDSKMAELYQTVSQNEGAIDDSAYPFESYMHVGAVLENPADGAIQALYPGPGFTGYKYNGTGRVITAKECAAISCKFNLAWQAHEQVGSSFKPYVLATAVKQYMNVKTSTLDGYNNVYIPPDSDPKAYPATTLPSDSNGWSPVVSNDDAGENGPYTPQVAMAASINTAYSDLWHVVGGSAVANMAQLFGVDTDAACITHSCGKGKNYVPAMEHEYGVTLGQASLTVTEQASMLATIDDNGVYHDPHLITAITQNNVPTPIKITTYPVFNSNAQLNAEEASQVQYAMSEDTASYGTAPNAALSNGQEIIAKTGTTNTAQSAFFVGAIPTQALVVALFTEEQNGQNGGETLNNLGGNSQGGYGGTWPATIWHSYAEDEFVPLGVEQFQPVVFTGQTWNEVPPGLRNVAKPHKKPSHGHGHGNGNGGNGGGGGGGNNGGGNPNPFPTYTCDPSVVTCGAAGGTGQSVSAVPAGAAVGGVFAGLPATCLWVRRRMRKRGPGRG
jgi:membrane peptidoglycan carboxypeptidase